MREENQGNNAAAKRAVMTAGLVIVALMVGIGVAQFLPADLFGLRHGQGESMSEGHDHASDGQLWTCGMHPHVIQDEPGQCPICGMNLTPIQGTAQADAGFEPAMADTWTCPDHSIIVESEAGTCPIDGQDLVASSGDGEGGRKILFYRNPMEPMITSPVPAKDQMGMDYEPIFADEVDQGASSGGGSKAVVRIDPAVVQNMNVRTQAVTRRDLTRPIRTVGHLEFDQQRMVTVTTKYSGWVEKVYVNYVGEEVKRGQPIFEIYSPELVQTQQELLSAIEFARDMSAAPEDTRQRALSMVDSARTRLGYWDISPRQIARLEETREVFRTLEVAAPAGGLVMKRIAGLEGMAVRPGLELFHIADLSSLWLSVELFEHQLGWVHEGTKAEIELSSFPGEKFHGQVRFLEPELSEKTRTMRAKIEIPNRKGRLRSGMYASVELQPVVVRDVLAVPSQAILRTGLRNVVVIALGDGRFAPQEVTLGHEAEGFAEIRDGLDEGALVVTSAQFLLDSESTLREAIQKMVAARRSDGAEAP